LLNIIPPKERLGDVIVGYGWGLKEGFGGLLE